jgi:NodT family efflux transporter outer membrane factor (OMF) lipoprotein
MKQTSGSNRPVQRLRWRVLAVASAASLLAACASVERQTVADAAPPPAQWYTALPHGGSVDQLTRWWEKLSDPLLVKLMMGAQKESPTLAAAASRMAQARALRVQTGSVLAPQFDVGVTTSRSVSTPGFSTQPVDTAQAGVQMSWELDVFGARRADRDSAHAGLEAAIADWHDARTLVAAEAGLTYLHYRFCMAELALSEQELASREQTAKLAALSSQAGLMSASQAALVRSAWADTANRVQQERVGCEYRIKAMVVLSGIPEPELRKDIATYQEHADRLLANTSWLDGLFNIASIPGQALVQRPDIYMAQSDVISAAYNVESSQAARWPRLSLSGFVGRGRSEIQDKATEMQVWTVGPLSLSIPLLDWGQRSARVDAARTRYEEATLKYRAKVRQAVREVEDALLHLRTSDERVKSGQTASEGYRKAMEAMQASHKAGLASQYELEDARRAHLVGARNLLASKRDRMYAWIELYRAAGGGWSPEAVNQTIAQKS